MIRRTRRSRMFGWEPNPLRRRTDRVEGGVVSTLILAFLIAAPLLVVLAGHWTRGVGMRQQSAEAAWRQVPALVERSAPAPRHDFAWPPGTIRMQARWTAPDGQPRKGWISVSRGLCRTAAPGCGSAAWGH
ncbi:MAG: hypothetical protein M3021_09505 [Actinomycetota bacterium]|nr:hypothetical protein [Actinomycetota bacterium]